MLKLIDTRNPSLRLGCTECSSQEGKTSSSPSWQAYSTDGELIGLRVVTGNGWRPHTEQVGQTGTKVAPDLYIACGISGATQHIAGCRNSKTMIVINNDPEAPILGYADYAVIGDLQKILPAIIEETRKAKAS